MRASRLWAVLALLLGLGLVLETAPTAFARSGSTRPPGGGQPPGGGGGGGGDPGKPAQQPNPDADPDRARASEIDPEKERERPEGDAAKLAWLEARLYRRLLDRHADATFQELFDERHRTAPELAWSALYFQSQSHGRASDDVGAGRGDLDAIRIAQDEVLREGDAKAQLRAFRSRAGSQEATADDHYLYGRLLDGEKAVGAFREALRIDPNHQRALVRLGTELLAAGSTDGASGPLGLALSEYPSSPVVLHANGWLRWLEGKPREAEKLLRRALAVDPRSTDARVDLGLLLLEQERLPEALEELDRAAALAPEDSYPEAALGRAHDLIQRDPERLEALEAARAKAAEAPSTEPPEASGDGGEERVEGEDNEPLASLRSVLAHYERAAKLEPGSAPILALHAEARLRDLPGSSVESYADEAIGIEPLTHLAHVVGVRNALVQGLVERALERAEAYRELDRKNATAYLLRGGCLMALGKPSKAQKEYAKAAGLAKADPLPAEAQGLMHWSVKRWKDAIKAYERVVALTDRDPESLRDLSDVLRQAAHPKEAAALLEELVAARPEDAAAWLSLARVCHAELRRANRRAAEAYRQYLALGGDDPQVPGWLQEVE